MIKAIFSWANRKIKTRSLAGDKVQCPICQHSFRYFLPYGVTKRPNAQCPNCKSLERHRMIWAFFQKRGILDHTKRLFHVSPESVFFKRFSQYPGLEYFPVDKFEPGYRYPAGTKNADITDIPYSDDFFDGILCVHVLEHVPDDHKAMRELFRVLKPGGWAVILVPQDMKLEKTYEDSTITSPQGRLAAFGQSDHVRLYGRDYADRLRSAGFDVTVLDMFEELSENTALRYALQRGEDLYLCTKTS